MADRHILPSGTVTFLFTDLEGSTRLWEEHPDAMHDALARHDELVREAIESHGGHVVKQTGDGFHAAFSTARDAVLAAVSAQVALETESWSNTGPLRVRMGLHTGEARHREGDYYGPELNRAARIMSAGHGGQMLMSHATQELVRDALTDGCELVPLGEHQLRDLGRPEALFQLTHADLQRDFGRVRSLDAYPGNLPLQVTSFVGRTSDMESVISSLEEARLVTLTGVGGVGKTRLALQVAGELLPKFPDGSWLVELAAAGDPESLVQVVAAVVGAVPHPSTPLATRVIDRLRDQQLLLVLDNCEHLLDAASGLAAAILRECRQVRLIATSREPLDVDGERVARVRSLALPEPEVDAGTMGASDAVQLFVERARHAEPDFEMDDARAPVIGEICRRLDGIPLAIELAAARVVSMTPAEILELLDERFRLLTGGRRTSVERHQTLRATVDWSYSLLLPAERTVFDRLGVFPGSFDAAAAQAVAGGDGVEDWDVRDAFTGLVSKSMVNTNSGVAETTRYQLLETLRQYSHERLDQSGDADRRRRAHAEYYAQLADDVAVAFLTGQDLQRRQFETVLDVDNYRVAVAWALDSDAPGDADLALRIAERLAGTDLEIRRRAGLIAHADRLLDRAESASPALHAGVLSGMANDALMLRGDVDAASDYARRAIDLGRASGGALAMAYATLSFCETSRGRFEQAVEILTEGQRVSIERDGTTEHGRAFFHFLLARAEAARGDTSSALLHAREAVQLSRDSEFSLRLSQSLNVVASMTRYDDLATARRLADESVDMARKTGLAGMLGNAIIYQAEFSAMAGDTKDAIKYLHAATDAWGEDVPLIIVVGAAGRACRIFADVDQLRPAATLGAAAQKGRYSHLLFNALDERARADLDDEMRHLRATLGDEPFDAEAARGTTMSSEEILLFIRHTAETVLSD